MRVLIFAADLALAVVAYAGRPVDSRIGELL